MLQSSQSPTRKVVLISGATSGIGREAALSLARAGYLVFAGYRDLTKGNALLADAQQERLPLSIVRLDVADTKTLREAVETVIRLEGRIDILVNNAGFGFAGPLEDLTLDEYRNQFETNFFGQVALTQATVPHMRTQRSGLIIFISSMAGRISYPLFSAYCASKHAIEAIGESLYYELMPFGIQSVLIEPGMIKTNFVKKNLAVGKNAMREDSPYGRALRDAQEYYHKGDDRSPGPDLVVRTIFKILRASKPKLRYQVGQDASLYVWLKKILPASWFEALVAKELGVHRYHER